MNSRLHPYLPTPPLLPRQRCRGYNMSAYCWYLNKALRFAFDAAYLDLRYGAVQFPDSPEDEGELGYDTTDVTINIEGDEVSEPWYTVPTEPVYVYHAASTAPFISRVGQYRKDWSLAWDDYDNDPTWGGGPTSGSATLLWGAARAANGYYYNEVWGQQLALQFDTSATDPSPLTITLRLDVDDILSEDLGTPAVKLYRLDEAVDPETHWSYTDNYIGETSIPTTGNYDISLTESDINIGGTTRILVRLSSTDVSQPIPPTWQETEYNSLHFDTSFIDNIWLKFTY